ncbi:SDR family oxidoreductase [Streptomyces sp. NPDC058655]|uniref:SDR family oxidoreductase n=1 Tax=unclassified Streptomyces TaxID=2593676 RepID=UPI0036480BE9
MTGLNCLVTGATGYIGGRLVPELLDAGHRVRCLARTPAKLRDHPWAGRAEVVAGDATDAESVAAALQGIDVAYYLVHALGGGSGFEERDRAAARIFAEQAHAAGVRRVVYLGGLIPDGIPARELSPHLRSRSEVGEILLAGAVPATVLRAAVIIGSGSASFEMLRYLTERLPVMVTPSWVGTRCQPIAVRDVLRYLVGSATMPPEVDRAFDIGGPDVLTYEEMMRRYALVAELPKRLILRVPMLTPRLSSHWIGLVTPVPRALARPLAESLRHEVVCAEHDIARYVPDPQGAPIGFDQALVLALRRVREAKVDTRWSSASVPGAPSDPLPTDPDWAGGSLYSDERERDVDASPEALWRVVEGIGGENGWYSLPLAWSVRGWLDRLAGGVGIRRGRRDAARLRVGDSLDFWRVEEIEPGRLLRLRAEMRLPGLAWLEMYAEPCRAASDGEGEPARAPAAGAEPHSAATPGAAAPTGAPSAAPAGPTPVNGAPGPGTTRTRYRQRALFHPHGLLGHMYWWSVSPFHALVFGGMARNIARAAERRDRPQDPAASDRNPVPEVPVDSRPPQH